MRRTELGEEDIYIRKLSKRQQPRTSNVKINNIAGQCHAWRHPAKYTPHLFESRSRICHVLKRDARKVNATQILKLQSQTSLSLHQRNERGEISILHETPLANGLQARQFGTMYIHRFLGSQRQGSEEESSQGFAWWWQISVNCRIDINTQASPQILTSKILLKSKLIPTRWYPTQNTPDLRSGTRHLGFTPNSQLPAPSKKIRPVESRSPAPQNAQNLPRAR